MRWGEIEQKEDAGDEKPSAARDDSGRPLRLHPGCCDQRKSMIHLAAHPHFENREHLGAYLTL